MITINLFFSWASEHLDNKEFIMRILNKVKEYVLLNDINLIIQESTTGVSGFVKIDEIIFDRIDKCDFFVADLSPICEHKNKLLPNSNVCFELGYMMGRHSEKRVFGMYNEKNINNPSVQLPFDFNHNRAMRIKINKEPEEQATKIEEYARVIENTINEFAKVGELHSKKKLKNHDKELNIKIVENMEIFKSLVKGCFENLEIYDCGQYDFLRDFTKFLSISTSIFDDSSLEKYRKKLVEALSNFLWLQCVSTHDFFNGNLRCTKRYFILEHPERCKEYGLPVIIDGDESNPKMKMYVDEAQTYRNSADEILNIYELLENRFVSLSD